jgi:hypothetical protein
VSAPGIESVEAAIAAQLAEIQMSNGYRCDVKRVYRVPLNADQPPEGNNLVILAAQDGIKFEADDSSAYRLSDRLVIGGIVNMGQADLMQPDRVQRTNWLLQDVLDALLEDQTFGFATNFGMVLEAGDRGVDSDRALGYFTLTLRVFYHFVRRSM